VRRLALFALVLAAAGALAAVLTGGSAQGSSTSRFDVIFDDARGLLSGQLIKIAGARAGRIENVVVTPDFKARIEATVDSRFMPFHQDASCAIRPEGLIAENYVDCDPGTAERPPLKGSGGHGPTVPVSHTTEPVSLLDLFNIFNLPTRQRFMVLIDELGIGTAGRGRDLNDILLRANPTLALTRQAIGILARQRAELQTIVDATNTIAAEGASHTANVQNFLDRAARLTTLTAAHSGSIAEAIRRLPGMLAATQPALAQLDAIARGGTPLLNQIHVAVPALNRVASDLGPFAAVAKPGLAKLSTALGKAIPAIRDTTPVVRTLKRYADRSRSGTDLFARLSSNLQQHGFVENFLSIGYYVGAALSRFDSTSHMLPLLLIAPNNGSCGNYATTPVPGCSAHYGSQPPYRPTSATAAEGASAPPGPGAHGRATQGATAPAARTASLRAGTPAGERKLVRQLIAKQLHGSKHATDAAAAQLEAVLQGQQTPTTAQTLRSLVDYLLR
jgi:phospholipid/cholesterol/gamma-HCH transport system substrate-binding protein